MHIVCEMCFYCVYHLLTVFTITQFIAMLSTARSIYPDQLINDEGWVFASTSLLDYFLIIQRVINVFMANLS